MRFIAMRTERWVTPMRCCSWKCRELAPPSENTAATTSVPMTNETISSTNVKPARLRRGWMRRVLIVTAPAPASACSG